VAAGEIAESTISNYYKAAKLFCEMNDLTLNWKKISRGIPQGRHAANDRAPTMEELKKLIGYPDRRIKPIVCLMVSSGIRIGCFDTLRWKDISPIQNKSGDVVAAKLIVYPVSHTHFPGATHSIPPSVTISICSFGECELFLSKIILRLRRLYIDIPMAVNIMMMAIPPRAGV
jgi:hypothetical protein